MNAISFKKWVSTILLLAITISLCGCSTNRTAASQDEHLTTTTAFIVLNGANVPALNSSAIASFVDTPQDGDRSILIVPDGNPSITTFSFDSTAKNVTYATAESKKWYKEICTSIIDARPDDADTDLLSAILLAANELKASDTQARHLMLLCNGLNTAPMLNFAETPFWSDATSIDEIISQLLKLNYLSADLLEDVDVTWAYLTSTSGLQKSLSPSMESRLLSFWQAYFDACGAKSVVFEKDMLTGPAAADDVPPIQVVNVEPDAVVLPDASADAAKAEEPTLTLDTQTLAFNADAAQTSAAEQLADRRRKMQEHLSDALAGLLYKWPLFAYGNAEDQDIRVMIVAEKSNILKQAINAVFSSCHVLGHQVHVLAAAPQAEAVVSDWMRGIDHAEDWFCYQDKPRPYNWKEKLGAVSWLNIQPEAETVRRAAAQFAPGSVLVLLDDDTEARKIAKAVPAPEAGKCLCAYTCVEGGQSLYAELDKGCVFVRLTPDDIEDAYSATAERIAFNAHLLYERQKNPSSSLLEIKHNFENFYNKSASYDTALAVKCRLFSINVPWTDDPEKDGYNFERALKEKPTAVKELAWVEHRRWVASKILNGARALPEKDFAYLKKGGANGSGTNFKKDGVLYHAYLVPSALDEVRPEGWQTAVEWRDSSRDAEIPQDLDALSHNGAALARMFAATAKKNRDVVHRGLKSFEGALEELTLELDSAAINELETHKKSLLHCIQKLLSPEARQADAAYYQIENVRMEHFLKEQLPASDVAVMQLEILNKNLFAILYSISPVEPKSLDNVLIENIGFQLRAKPMVLAKLLGTEDLRANLAPARAFEVSKLIYIAQADTDGAAEKYIHIAEDAAAALHHYGAGADAVELRLIAGAQTEIPACNGLQVKIVPANKAPEETMQQILQGVEILDLTNGQEDLCTLAGIYAECDMIVKRDGTFRALRGKVPAQLPIPQPWDVDGLFRLSGAMPHKEEDTQTKIDYEKVNTLYRQILENFGRAAFYDICRDFAEAYSKQSTTYFSQMAGPDAQMQTYTMPTERWEELEPLLRKLQKYKYIRNLTSMVKAGQAKIAFMAGQKCAASLDYALKNCIDGKSVLKDFGTERNVFVIHTEPAVVRVPVARQAVVDFLQTQGCLQSALVYGKLEISGMAPEIPALLQKFGNALEGGVFANLQGNTRFSDEKISYEYKWGSGTLNELDVVAVMDKEKLVLISCKACRQLEIAFVDEIAIRAASLHVGAIPVLVCSELQPGDKKAFRDRCRSQGVLLVDAADMGKAAEKICCAAESEA